MSMLPTRLVLWNITDAEAFCQRVAEAHLRWTRKTLPPHERDDFLAFLLSEIWRISGLDKDGKAKHSAGSVPKGVYDPARGITFSTFAYRTLRLRSMDHVRSTKGRTKWQWANHSYERVRPIVQSLDAPTDNGSSLGETVSTRTPDPGECGATTIAGIFGSGGSVPSRDPREIGRELIGGAQTIPGLHLEQAS